MQKMVEGRQGVPLNFLVPAVEGERVQVQRIHYCRSANGSSREESV